MTLKQNILIFGLLELKLPEMNLQMFWRVTYTECFNYCFALKSIKQSIFTGNPCRIK